MSIQANLKEVLSELPAGVRLVAVSKFHPNEALEEAYAAGQRIFGESHVQEMTQKYETCPKTLMAFHRPPANKQSQIHGPLCSYDTCHRLV